MGVFNLRWFCSAFLFVPLAVHSGGVSTEIAVGTTSYKVIKETVSAPLGTSVSSPRDVNPVPRLERLPSGGISQSASGDLYIADKKAKFGFSGKFKFDKDTLKGGAKKVLKLNPLSLAGAVGLMGLDALLRDAGLSVDESGGVFKEGSYPDIKDVPSLSYDYVGTASRLSPAFEPISGFINVGYSHYNGSYYQYGYYCSKTSSPNRVAHSLVSYSFSGYGANCYYRRTENVNPSDIKSPASTSDIDSAVDSSYEPDVSDWPALFPYIEPDAFELDPIPSFSFPPVTSTSTNPSTGLVTTVESQTVLDFEVDNSTATPSITITESETSTKYENGVKVDETTTVKPSTPPQTSTGGGGGVTSADDAFELPSFCSWASVVCSWIGWTQELPDGSEPDLSSLVNDDDFARDYSISFGTKQCPLPMQLNVALLNEPIEVSFDPFCELAGYLYYFVMVSAYFIAIRISLGVAKDG